MQMDIKASKMQGEMRRYRAWYRIEAGPLERHYRNIGHSIRDEYRGQRKAFRQRMMRTPVTVGVWASDGEHFQLSVGGW